jgi:methionyl-tRNA formyltransferase
MRIVFFGNGPVALDALRYLRSIGEEIVALVLHNEGARKLGEEMIAECGLPVNAVFEAKALGDANVVRTIGELQADVGLSVLFAHILKAEVLQLFPRGVLNVHPGYLPYNRGRNAQIWGIVDGTPVGATLHYMDEGVDTGPIVERVEVVIAPTDTGWSLRAKLESASADVLKKGWPAVFAGTVPVPQDASAGTAHRVRDVEEISEIDLDATYRAGDLIDLLRALTSAPQAAAAFFRADGRKVRVTLELSDEDG